MIPKYLRRHPWLLVGLFSFVALNIATITRYSFWFDESFSAALIDKPFSELINLTGKDVHPPLYYLILKVWSGIFGSGDLALRSFSLLAMTLAIFATFILVKRLFSLRTANIALPFMILGPFTVRYAQEARMYALSTLFLVMATIILAGQMRRKREHRSRWLWLAYAIFMVLAMYTHYFSALLFVTHGFYVLSHGYAASRAKTKLNKLWHSIKTIDIGFIFAGLLTGLLYLPWVPTLLAQFSVVNEGFWIGGVDEKTFAGTISYLFGFYELNDRVGSGLVFAAALAGLAILAYAYYKVFQVCTSKKRHSLWLLVGAVVAPAIVLFLFSLMPSTSPIYYFRYFAQYSLLFYAGVGALMALASKHYKSAGSLLLACVLAVQVVGVTRVITGADRDQFAAKELMAALNPMIKEGDGIITQGLDGYFDTYHYNITSSQVQIMPADEYYGSHEPILRDPGALIVDPSSYTTESGRHWYIGLAGETGESLPKEWQLIDRIEYTDRALLLYQNSGSRR